MEQYDGFYTLEHKVKMSKVREFKLLFIHFQFVYELKSFLKQNKANWIVEVEI